MDECKVAALTVFAGKGLPGTVKEKVICSLDDNRGGIEGDFHFEEGERQISFLSEETEKWMEQQEIKGLCFQKYKANIVTEGCGCQLWPEGTVIQAGDAVLQITDRSKRCFPECERYAAGMECRLREGCGYGKVISGGEIRTGDPVSVLEQKKIYNWNRYKRQMSIEMIGEEGQKKLKESSVLVVGAGGLGCPVITALAEAGIGRIGIVDGDVVEETNLNRQFLYTPSDIGKGKAACAARWLCKFRPDIRVDIFECRLDESNAAEIMDNYDIVIAAVDNVGTRMVINKTAKASGIPLVDGAIDGFYGTIVSVTDENTPCLACLNPEGKEPARVSSSLGTTTMVVGALEAQCAVMYLAGVPGRAEAVMSYDGIYGTLEGVPVVKNPACKICGRK